MTKSNLQNPVFIIAIICFLAAIAISAFLLWPRFQKFEITRTNIIAIEKKLQDREAHFIRIKEERKRMEEEQEQLFKVASALPSDAEISLPSLFRFLREISSGLILTEIGSFTISPIEEREIKKTQVSFQVIGSYDSLKAMLEKLEKSARIIIVENISFSTPEQGGLFTFDIGIRVYSL